MVTVTGRVTDILGNSDVFFPFSDAIQTPQYAPKCKTHIFTDFHCSYTYRHISYPKGFKNVLIMTQIGMHIPKHCVDIDRICLLGKRIYLIDTHYVIGY